VLANAVWTEAGMSFVRALIRVDRWQEWHLSVPIYDGRDCPECGALCIGKNARRVHQQWHMRRTEFDSVTRDALRRLVVAAGLNPVELDPSEAPDGLYDDEGLDERLTRKARIVVGEDDYDEDSELV
jgi:hypothetical protein